MGSNLKATMWAFGVLTVQFQSPVSNGHPEYSIYLVGFVNKEITFLGGWE